MQKLDKKSGHDYLISGSLSLSHYLYNEAVGYIPQKPGGFTKEEARERIVTGRDKVSFLLKTLSNEAKKSKNPKLRELYVENNKDGSICEGSLIFRISLLLEEYYSKPLHQINCDIGNVILGSNRLDVESLGQRIRNYKKKLSEA